MSVFLEKKIQNPIPKGSILENQRKEISIKFNQKKTKIDKLEQISVCLRKMKQRKIVSETKSWFFAKINKNDMIQLE